MKKQIKDLLLTAGILAACFLCSLATNRISQTPMLIPMFFVLGVFLISVLTSGYRWGVAASLLSVLAVNFAFTFPYFEFNFSIPVNFFSAVVMLVVAIVTCALTKKITYAEKLKADSEREKMRANLLRAVSHDLRTPLTTIYGSSAMLLENFDRFSDADRQKLLRGIRDDAQWLVGMVENLLSVTRLDNGELRLNKTETVLEELIDTVLVKFRKRCPEQHVTVTIPEDFLSIPMDAVLIGQVLTNLLENAVIHARGMTVLELLVRQEGDRVRFTVRDNGCGIAPDRLEDLFTGYLGSSDRQGDAQRRNMGIGLSVCATIVKAHGGRISAKNRPTGGAEFTFTLDLEE
jgi:two-component system sensor histidine kinase KdpD